MAMEALVPQAAARVRRLDLRVVIGILLMLFAVAANATFIRKAQDRSPVLVAAESVQPGEVITADHLRVEWISAADGIDYLPGSARADIVGQIAAEPLTPGKIIGNGAVIKTPALPAGFVAMSLALKPDKAAAGELRPGDRVAVISSVSPDRPDARTTILLRDVEILSARDTQNAEGSNVLVVLKIRLEEARAIAEAQAAGAIHLVLQSGESE